VLPIILASGLPVSENLLPSVTKSETAAETYQAALNFGGKGNSVS
jgi:hypothetical protein